MDETPETVRSDVVDSRTSWSIVVVSFVALFFAWGTVFTFSVYASALESTFDISAIQTSTAYSVQLFVFFIAGGSVAIFASRIRLRLVMVVASGTAATGVALLQVVDTFLLLTLSLSLVGSAAGVTFVIVISLVPQWFDEYEGRAMGVAVVGNGLGVQVLPVVWLTLLAQGDVRVAYLAVGGAFAASLLLAALFFRRPPMRTTDSSRRRGVTWTWFRRLVGDRQFRFAIVGVPMVWAWYHVLSAHLVDVLTETGMGRAAAAGAFGFMGGVSIVSRLASGTIADAVGVRRTLMASVVITAVGLVSVSFGPTFALASVVTFGIGLGGVATLYSPALVEAFGPENATAVNGVFQLSLGVSGLLAPVAMSAAVSYAGGYRLPLAALAGLTAVGSLLFWAGTTPDREAKQEHVVTDSTGD